MKKWYSITAQGATATLELRGDVGIRKPYYDAYWGETIDTGGAGTVAEFDEELKALGKLDELQVFITSYGGDVSEGIAIHNILARQEARVIVTIDGYAYSIATVIAMAGDEVRMAANGLMFIHDAEYWCTGSDIESLQKNIKTLEACNAAMAAAYAAKSGDTPEAWMQRMTADTWLTGAQAKELRIVDTLLNDVALTAFAPVAKITARLKPPAEITALIDKALTASAPSTPPIIDMSKEEIEALVTGQVSAATTELRNQHETSVTALRTDLEGKVTAAAGEVTALKQTITDQAARITAQEAELKTLKALDEHGIKKTTASSDAPVTGAGKKPGDGEETASPRERSVKALAALPVFSAAAK